MKYHFQQVKTRKKIGLFKDELGRKIMKEFVGVRAKTWACLMDDDSEHKNAKETKKCVMKRILKFISYLYCLLEDIKLIDIVN